MRVFLIAALVVGSTSIAAIRGPAPAAAAQGSPALSASLDGREIPLADVSKYFCDDFSYPVIRCSADPGATELRVSRLALLAAVDYVTIYDQPSFAGNYMHVSQDYTALFLIGWSDRVSSFRGRNSETGRFYTDWFYGGTPWNFCCNQLVPVLYGYDNTFSSVVRT